MPTATTIPIPEALGPALAFAGGQDLYRAAVNALKYASAEVSNCPVGAAALLDTAHTITGANREYPSDGSSNHAEQMIIMALGNNHIWQLIVVDKNGMAISPCGACRDKLLDTTTPDAKILVPTSVSPLSFAWVSPQALLPNDFPTNASDLDSRQLRSLFVFAKSRLEAVKPHVPLTHLFRLAVARTTTGKTFLGYHIDDSAFQHDYAIEAALNAAYTDGEADNIALILFLHNQDGPVFPEGRGRHKLYKRAKKQDIAVVSASVKPAPGGATKFYFSSARALYPYAFDPEELRT